MSQSRLKGELVDDVLNVAAFRKQTHMVGPGLRDAIWVQGCSIDCPGCANQSYLAHELRRPVSVAQFLAHFKTRIGTIDGVSILGGEPTEQADAVAQLLAGVQGLGLSTVVFSGRILSDLEKDKSCQTLLEHTDLLIDGPFIKKYASPELYWRGSSNQQFHCLSSRFTPADLTYDGPNGEILLSEQEIFFHGVGTRVFWK